LVNVAAAQAAPAAISISGLRRSTPNTSRKTNPVTRTLNSGSVTYRAQATHIPG
jgi:hypothetical protein